MLVPLAAFVKVSLPTPMPKRCNSTCILGVRVASAFACRLCPQLVTRAPSERRCTTEPRSNVAFRGPRSSETSYLRQPHGSHPPRGGGGGNVSWIVSNLNHNSIDCNFRTSPAVGGTAIREPRASDVWDCQGETAESDGAGERRTMDNDAEEGAGELG